MHFMFRTMMPDYNSLLVTNMQKNNALPVAEITGRQCG
jgi:hypothetical protein